jgi:uracil-DNA glycosylase
MGIVPVGMPPSRSLPWPARSQDLVDELAASSIGRTFNQYRDGPRAELLRARLASYLHARERATVLLVGEAAGYRGARVSGIPFTSERQLTGREPGEASATIVRRVLVELGLEERVLLWNVVPTHPGTPSVNRAPDRTEVAAGLPFVERLATGRTVIAVGRVAERALDAAYVRHPAHGGGKDFRAGLVELLDRGPPRPP